MIVISYNTCWYVYNFRLPLIRALKERGYEVTVFAPRDEYTDRVVAEGVAFRDMPIEGKGKNPLSELKTLLAFRRAYKELQPEIALQYTIKPNLYGSLAARTLGLPVINNITGLGEAFASGGLTETVVRILYRIAFKRVDLVFFQNPDDKSLFVGDKIVREGQAELLPGSGVDTGRFAPMPRGSGPFTFLQIGRLLKAKGAEDFIAAARQVKEKRSDVRFALVGRYEPNDPNGVDAPVFEKAREDGIVDYWGEVDDVRPLIAQADCVVLPSYYREGIPRSLLEAASMGKPLVAADSVGTREPVVVGRNGFLHRPRDPGDLARKLFDVLSLDTRALDAMGAESRALMRERFEESIVIDKYLASVERFKRRTKETS
jgi:glycosyltransferase involved in cell wall biosynthesis